jgi:hypothetical protein
VYNKTHMIYKYEGLYVMNDEAYNKTHMIYKGGLRISMAGGSS